MKPTQNNTAGTEKEKQSTIAGHTPGELYVGVRGNYIYSSDNSTGLRIEVYSDTTEEDKANAARIVAAWNEYDQLKQNNEALREAVELAAYQLSVLSTGRTRIDYEDGCKRIYTQLQTALNQK